MPSSPTRSIVTCVTETRGTRVTETRTIPGLIQRSTGLDPEPAHSPDAAPYRDHPGAGARVLSTVQLVERSRRRPFHCGGDYRLGRRLDRAPLPDDESVRRLSRPGRRQAAGRRVAG